MRKNLLALFFGMTAIMLIAESTDGPYVMLTGDGGVSAWYADPKTDSGFVKRVVRCQFGDEVTIAATEGRPAFSVKLRPVETNSAPDSAPWPEGPVFVMADSHGEYAICTELLIKHGVITPQLEWNFGHGRLVILGDVFDRGARQTEILWLIYKLEAEALAAGGRVHFNLGNHETMVLTNNVSYLNSRYHKVTEALFVANYAELWSPDTLLGKWIRSKPTVFKLGNTLFMHGGVSIATVNKSITISEINSAVRSWLNEESSKNSGRMSFITGQNGPLWYRGLVKPGATAAEVDAMKQFFEVERFAVGHTVVDTVTARYRGSVVAVQVYPRKDGNTGRMTMQGVYIDPAGTWHIADVSGSREPLKDKEGDIVTNSLVKSAIPEAKAEEKVDKSSDEKASTEPDEKSAAKKKAA